MTGGGGILARRRALCGTLVTIRIENVNNMLKADRNILEIFFLGSAVHYFNNRPTSQGQTPSRPPDPSFVGPVQPQNPPTTIIGRGTYRPNLPPHYAAIHRIMFSPVYGNNPPDAPMQAGVTLTLAAAAARFIPREPQKTGTKADLVMIGGILILEGINWNITMDQFGRINSAERQGSNNIQTNHPHGLQLRNITAEQLRNYFIVNFDGQHYFYDGVEVPVRVDGWVVAGSSATRLTQNEADDAVGKLTSHNRDHILQEHHEWRRLVPNPQDPNNWHKITTIISTVLAQGNHEAYGRAYSATMRIGTEVVRVTYQIVNGVVRISNAWVVTR